MHISIPDEKRVYPAEPGDAVAYTIRFDKAYARYARLYDLAVKALPFWKTWIRSVIPFIEGPRVLEASFGTGYLLTHYAGRFETHGVDYSREMIRVARKNLRRRGLVAELRRADVERLPYPDGHFDNVVCTMAFSGYPDGRRAMSELNRVLRGGGRLLMVDFDYPEDKNLLGCGLVKLMAALGDTIRDMAKLVGEYPFEIDEREIGGFGSIHLVVARKRTDPQRP